MVGTGTLVRLSQDNDSFGSGTVRLFISEDFKTAEVRIPKEITSGELAIIKAAIYSGDLIVVEEKDMTRPVLENPEGVLLQGSKQLVSNTLDNIAQESEAFAKLSELLSLEEKGKNKWGQPRAGVIKKMKELLDGLAGITKIQDEDVEAVEIEVK